MFANERSDRRIRQHITSAIKTPTSNISQGATGTTRVLRNSNKSNQIEKYIALLFSGFNCTCSYAFLFSFLSLKFEQFAYEHMMKLQKKKKKHKCIIFSCDLHQKSKFCVGGLPFFKTKKQPFLH